MKLSKNIRRFCPTCRRHTQHSVKLGKTGFKRGSMKHGSIKRAAKRGLGVGFGNKGRWGSKPAKPKRTGAKSTKKASINYTCEVCKKTSLRSKGIRAKKVELE